MVWNDEGGHKTLHYVLKNSAADFIEEHQHSLERRRGNIHPKPGSVVSGKGLRKENCGGGLIFFFFSLPFFFSALNPSKSVFTNVLGYGQTSWEVEKVTRLPDGIL